MADIRVTCITKPARDSKHDAITHLGGSGWKWTKAQVIASIEAKANTFHTLVNGNRGDIGVVNGTTGKYLRTYADGQWNDNLLSLPECP